MPPRPRRRAPAVDPLANQLPLPPVHVDAYASLEPVEIDIDFAGQTWSVPLMFAADWLELLWAEPFDVDDIFPGLVHAEDALNEGLLTGSVELDDSFDIAMEVLEQASGYRWWFALKLITAMKVLWWRMGGMLLLRGIDARQMSLGAWCTAALDLCIENMDQQKMAEFLTELNTAPPGHESSQDEDADAFLMAMRQAL